MGEPEEPRNALVVWLRSRFGVKKARERGWEVELGALRMNEVEVEPESRGGPEARLGLEGFFGRNFACCSIK